MTRYLSAAAILSRDDSTDLKQHAQPHTHIHNTGAPGVSVLGHDVQSTFPAAHRPHVSSVQPTTSTPKSGAEHVDEMMRWLIQYIFKSEKIYIPVTL